MPPPNCGLGKPPLAGLEANRITQDCAYIAAAASGSLYGQVRTRSFRLAGSFRTFREVTITVAAACPLNGFMLMEAPPFFPVPINDRQVRVRPSIAPEERPSSR